VFRTVRTVTHNHMCVLHCP